MAVDGSSAGGSGAAAAAAPSYMRGASMRGATAAAAAAGPSASRLASDYGRETELLFRAMDFYAARLGGAAAGFFSLMQPLPSAALGADESWDIVDAYVGTQRSMLRRTKEPEPPTCPRQHKVV